jgi:hypothetical protein
MVIHGVQIVGNVSHKIMTGPVVDLVDSRRGEHPPSGQPPYEAFQA